MWLETEHYPTFMRPYLNIHVARKHKRENLSEKIARAFWLDGLMLTRRRENR